MDEPDYYSADVPADNDEEEVLEVIPLSAGVNVGSNSDQLGDSDGEDLDSGVENELDPGQSAMAEFERLLGEQIGGKGVYKSNSKAEMLARIRNELSALEHEDGDDDEVKELIEKVDEMGRRSVFVEAWRTARKVPNDVERSDVKVAAKSDSADKISSFVDFEARLADVEKRLGPRSGPEDRSELSLQDIITDLYKKVNLVLSDSAGDLCGQLKVLSDGLDDYLKKKHGVNGEVELAPTDQKINRLYDRMQEAEQFEETVPLVVKRLQSMNNVVAETSSTVDFMSGLAESLDRIEKQVDHWNERMDSLEKS